MAKQFKLQVFTQEKKILDESVTSIQVPGEDGYLGVLADHAPLITTLGSGTLTVTRENQVKTMKVTGGFLEVVNNVATVLADEALPG
ncbi:MAG: ATP synthase F1 subunit epsilon [Candidatus Sumerlaeaceae bacterium]|nr:ATP synthase F1 subunit epsilon [Candidatus Sumerlaeaceae bacterium]